HTEALKGSDDWYSPPCFNKRRSISFGGGVPARSTRRRKWEHWTGLKSISAERRPPKSATTKIRCLLASLRAPAQYWASMSRQDTSGVPPRTIPAFPHLPEGGIGT